MTSDELGLSADRRWRRRLIPAAVFLGLAFVFAATSSRPDLHIDTLSTALGSWRIAGTGNADLSLIIDEYAPGPDHANLWVGPNSKGQLVPYRSSGAVAIGVPMYWLAGATEDLSSFQIWPAQLTALLLSASGLTLLGAAVARTTRTSVAWGSIVLLGLSTPIWPVAAGALWTHSLTLFSIGGIAYSTSRSRWLAAGVFGGIALWARLHTVLITAVLGLGLALRRRDPKIAFTMGLVGAVFTLGAMAWSQWMYQSWSPGGAYRASGYIDKAGSTGFLDIIVNQLGLWISPGRGILVWTPALLVLLPSLVRGWRSAPDWTQLLALGGLIYLVVQGLANDFTGGDGFYGYRHGIEFIACLTPLIVHCLHLTTRGERLILGPIVGLQVGAMLLGVIPISEGRRDVLMDEAWHLNGLVRLLANSPNFVWVLVVAAACGAILSFRLWGSMEDQSDASGSR